MTDAQKPARHSPKHRAEYALARTLESAVATLPEGAADAVGRRVGRMVHGLGIRRGVVEANLRLAYPAADDAWIERTVRATYEHLGREAAAILRPGGASGPSSRRRWTRGAA